MADHDWVSERFAEHHERLRAVAYRMLHSTGDAEDAVQEAWVRVSRADTDQVDNPGGWLTTVVARVCLNMLEARRARPEDPTGALPPEPPATDRDRPEDDAVLADSVGLALVVVLDTLTPAERLAFVLHDVFDVSFGEIGAIIDRSPVAARQLASRARRRVRGAAATSDAARSRKREVVAAFLAASQGGDFAALLALLDADAVLVADPAAVRMGAPAGVRGAREVAATFAGRAQAARLALVDGVPAAVWTRHGRPRVLFGFTVEDGTITGITLEAEEDRLRDLDVVFLAGER
ncbi:MAG: sigma-70 family RNA polymerase sigma factor [Saccharothrix sp.]|nr:sigma-70 family RNA polymerase sigma factor [Saccharothrix sp.]